MKSESEAWRLETIYTSIAILAVAASLADFIATLRLTWADPESPGEKIFSYWNNQDLTFEKCRRDVVLHIVRSSDGTFYLEIANLLHHGTLEQLESILYTWAFDEVWLD